MRFEWDDDKNLINIKNHGVSFEESQQVFLDEFALEEYDGEHSTFEEQRFIRLGLSRNNVLFVVFTMRGKDEDIYRLISARKADKYEETTYWQERQSYEK